MANVASVSLIEKARARRFHRWKGYALSMTGDAAEAEEVVQEAIARTLQANPRLKTERDAHNYVLAAVRTAALQLFDQRRKRALFGVMPWQLGSSESADPLSEMLAEEAMNDGREMQRRALAKLAGLPETQRQAIELLVLREPPMRLREVAEIQDAAISTVYSRLRAGLSALGREMFDSGGGNESQ